MAQTSQFLPYIQPNVQGCPLAILNSALASTLLDFCERSQLWTRISEKTSVIPNVPRYTFMPEEQAVAVEASLALCEGRPLIQTTLDALNTEEPDWRSKTGRVPTKFFMDTSHSIRLYPEPTELIEDGLQVQISMKPKRDAKELPDFLYENWAETIAHGTLARLFAMSGKDWANPQLVGYHSDEYRAGLSRAKTKTIKSRQNVSLKVKNRPFGAF